MNEKTLIIAEAGSNHNGDIKQAFRLIDVATQAKVDIVKFQTFSLNTLYSKYTPDFAKSTDLPKLIRSLEIPRSWQNILKSYCDDHGIEFMSTPCDEKAVDELYDLNIKRLKVAGFECTDPRLVKYIASTQLPLIISVGIGTDLSSIKEIYNWVLEANKTPDITFLHCNNAYPTPFKDINLGTMREISQKADYPNTKVGLSDHTEGILTPPIAVSLGAKAIEKHYTIDKSLSGPDHPFSIEPNELTSMVKNIRLAETMLGSKQDEYTESELAFSKGRRSVVVVGNTKKGEIISEKNISTKRPLLDQSIPAKEYYNILGKRFSKDLRDDMILKEGDIE